MVHADVDFRQIEAAKVFVDSAGHYARPDVMRLVINRAARNAVTFETGAAQAE